MGSVLITGLVMKSRIVANSLKEIMK